MTQDSESVVVPRVPTQAMREAATEIVVDDGRGGRTALNWEEADEVWSAMLAAAPSTSVREEELEAALRPFADAADDLDDEHRDGSDIWEASVGMSITAGDLRRARAALVPSTDEGKRHG